MIKNRNLRKIKTEAELEAEEELKAKKIKALLEENQSTSKASSLNLKVKRDKKTFLLDHNLNTILRMEVAKGRAKNEYDIIEEALKALFIKWGCLDTNNTHET